GTMPGQFGQGPQMQQQPDRTSHLSVLGGGAPSPGMMGGPMMGGGGQNMWPQQQPQM
ncbi:unnamed protein product, partial [Polarella glacialis]